MSERPTPHPSGAWSRSNYTKAYDDLERQLADARAQLRIADEQIALERGALTHARNVLSRILADLPHNRDWLDPAVEREARDIVSP